MKNMLVSVGADYPGTLRRDDVVLVTLDRVN